MDNGMRGKMHSDVWVRCGDCGNSQYVDTVILKSAVKEAKKMGWVYTKRNGWICPECKGKKVN